MLNRPKKADAAEHTEKTVGAQKLPNGLVCSGLKEIAETTTIGLRTVIHIVKNWKDSGEPSSLRKKCGGEKKS